MPGLISTSGLGISTAGCSALATRVFAACLWVLGDSVFSRPFVFSCSYQAHPGLATLCSPSRGGPQMHTPPPSTPTTPSSHPDAGTYMVVLDTAIGPLQLLVSRLRLTTGHGSARLPSGLHVEFLLSVVCSVTSSNTRIMLSIVYKLCQRPPPLELAHMLPIFSSFLPWGRSIPKEAISCAVSYHIVLVRPQIFVRCHSRIAPLPSSYRNPFRFSYPCTAEIRSHGVSFISFSRWNSK